MDDEGVDVSSEWTDEKNRRRCELVDREIEEMLSPGDEVELKNLQTEMLAYRRKVAPLPLKQLRELHQELLREAGTGASRRAEDEC